VYRLPSDRDPLPGKADSDILSVAARGQSVAEKPPHHLSIPINQSAAPVTHTANSVYLGLPPTFWIAAIIERVFETGDMVSTSPWKAQRGVSLYADATDGSLIPLIGIPAANTPGCRLKKSHVPDPPSKVP